MGRRLGFLRRARSVLLSIRTKSSDRIISDCKVVSPLANDKGTVVNDNGRTKKRSLTPSKSSSFNRTGIRNK